MDALVECADIVLDSFFEDPAVDYWWKRGMPERLREDFQWKIKAIPKDSTNGVVNAEAIGKLDIRTIRMMNDLVSILQKHAVAPTESPTPPASSFAVNSLSRYVAWYLSPTLSSAPGAEKRLDAVIKAQRNFAAFLEDHEYDPATARAVLRCAEESRLDEVLSAEAVAEIKKDKRFSGDEDQRILDALHQRIVSKGKP